ncbi:uncharacterized protein LOC141679396 [Apium graveolens]|uniref:uncharacterized protein LOC141679396 n=1 Tax=Apium graveolens TaxID=4045 RepID=UPI003D797222
MTKWAEAKSTRIINQQDCIKFMDSIVMRFGILMVLILDKGPQFVGSDFEAYLKELGIKHKRAFVAHPREMDKTTPMTGTGETPFKLAYGTEARLLVETGSPSHKVVNFDEVSNIEALKTNLELLDEVRDRAVANMESYKEKTKLYFTRKTKIREYEGGDLVLRDTEVLDPTNQGKLQPNWEGP